MCKKNQTNYDGVFADERLDQRCNQIAKDMYESGSAVIEQFNADRKEVVGSCRFFNNPRVEVRNLTGAVTHRTAVQCKGRKVLCIEDTTGVNFTSKLGRIKPGSLGPLTRAEQTGFFIHSTLVVDARDFSPIGLSNIQVWKRNGTETKHDRKYQSQPMESKESYRWISAIDQSKYVLQASTHKIIIADREADIYALHVRLKDPKTDVVIRMRGERVTHENQTVKALLGQQKVKTRHPLKVKTDLKDNRTAHTALLEIKYCSVTIKKSPSATNKGLPSYCTMQVVQAKESSKTVKKGDNPIEWTILTSLPVDTARDAKEILEYYSKRWMIEELFSLLKTRGLNLEKSQLNDGLALMKLSVMAMDTAVKILQLTKGRKNEIENADQLFDKDEIKLLSKLQKKYEGDTFKQKNNFRVYSLAWAAWVIARMGGWKGYESESPPGNKTMKRGLEMFYTMLILFKLE